MRTIKGRIWMEVKEGVGGGPRYVLDAAMMTICTQGMERLLAHVLMSLMLKPK